MELYKMKPNICWQQYRLWPQYCSVYSLIRLASEQLQTCSEGQIGTSDVKERYISEKSCCFFLLCRETSHNAANVLSDWVNLVFFRNSVEFKQMTYAVWKRRSQADQYCPVLFFYQEMYCTCQISNNLVGLHIFQYASANIWVNLAIKI